MGNSGRYIYQVIMVSNKHLCFFYRGHSIYFPGLLLIRRMKSCQKKIAANTYHAASVTDPTKGKQLGGPRD